MAKAGEKGEARGILHLLLLTLLLPTLPSFLSEHCGQLTCRTGAAARCVDPGGDGRQGLRLDVHDKTHAICMHVRESVALLCAASGAQALKVIPYESSCLGMCSPAKQCSV